MNRKSPFKFRGLSLAEIRRRIHKYGASEPPTPLGKQPVRIGDILRRMEERGELPRAKDE